MYFDFHRAGVRWYRYVFFDILNVWLEGYIFSVAQFHQALGVADARGHPEKHRNVVLLANLEGL
ncbi:MAG: hypothetical protein VB026_09770, partial [Anaerolineaceae bacterium]|nr:hypothetical protein [Anaerolineaceae bacterium]